MPFLRPTLDEIKNRVKTDIETRLTTGKLLYNSILNILGIALAGASHGLHGYIAWAARQLFPDTAEAEYLERWAGIWGITRKAASFATGNVNLTGTNATVVPSGVELQRQDGQKFITTTGGTITGGVLVVAVTASNAGVLGNTDAGTTLTFTTPLAGVNADAVVATGGIAAGAEIENDTSLLDRLLTRIQKPPQGGADYDYVKWALEVAGVTRAFCYPMQFGLGTVGVAILADDDPDGPTAPAPLLDDVQDHIDFVRPVTADVTVWTPDPVELNFTIDLNPDSAATRLSVEASLRDLLRREAEPGKTILLSKIREAVSTAAGENDNAVTVPAANFTVEDNEIAVFGTITWL